MISKKSGLFLLAVSTALSMIVGVSCSDRTSPSHTKETIGQLQEPVELWLCNYEPYDLFVAMQGEYTEAGSPYEFNKGWVLVPKRTADKEYSCVDVTRVVYPYPTGVDPTSPGAKTSKYGIGGASPTSFVRTESGFYTPAGYSSYEAFSNDAYATLCIPESGAQAQLDDTGKTPFTVEYTVKPGEDSLARLCPKDIRRVAAMTLRMIWDSSMSRPFGSGEWGDSGDGERYRFNFRDGLSSEAPPKIDFDEYGYDVKSPVPVDVRKIVREKIIPRAPVEGGQLELALKKWKGQLTPKQELVLQTIIELGKAFDIAAVQAADSAKAIVDRLKSITQGAAQAVKDVAICIAKVGAAGDYGDWYEVALGKDFCSGEELTIPGRAITALGLIAGQGKFWRAIGNTLGVSTTVAKVGKKAGELLDQFTPKFVKLAVSEAEQALGEISRLSRQSGFKSPEEVDSILREVEDVLETSGCSVFMAMHRDSMLDRVLGLIEGTAYAASCTSSQAKKLLVDEFKKNTKYRADFLSFTKKTAAEVQGFDCHHMFPQKFRARFTTAKVKIDDPKFLTWWESKPHQSASRAYNKAWDEWFLEFPNPTTEQVLAKGKLLALEYSLTIHY